MYRRCDFFALSSTLKTPVFSLREPIEIGINSRRCSNDGGRAAFRRRIWVAWKITGIIEHLPEIQPFPRAKKRAEINGEPPATLCARASGARQRRPVLSAPDPAHFLENRQNDPGVTCP